MPSPEKAFYEFYCPVKILAGMAALEHLPFELQMLGGRRPMVITDQGVLAAGLYRHVEEAFAGSGIEVAAIYADVPPDSSLETVRDAAHLWRAQQCDAILAVGGGSVIDTSKAVNILVSEGGDDLARFAGAHHLKRPLKPLMVIPTTAGTGSEATMVAVITDRKTGVKLPFSSYFLMPNAAILDPRMTMTMPPHITAMTAMDALTHAVESYSCLAGNPLSEAFASRAVRKISENLLKVLDDPQDAVGRLALAQASTLAGVAFSNSMVGLVHSLGHALGALCHLPHGLCMNLFLPYALEYNRDVNGEKIGELLLPLCGPERFAQTPAAARADAVIAHIRYLRDELYTRTKLPRTLRETGKVSADMLPKIAAAALDDGSLIFNPKDADFDDLMAVLNRAW
jgi:alcohol dehydrogenase